MSGAEDDEVAKWYEKGKYKLLFDNIKKGLQICMDNPPRHSTPPARPFKASDAESMAHTLIILVWSCEQKLVPSQHVKHATHQQLLQLDEQLISFTIEGKYWTVVCKTGLIREFRFPKGFECFARHSITMTFKYGILKTNFNLDNGADDGNDMDYHALSLQGGADDSGADDMMYGNFTDRCVQQMSW